MKQETRELLLEIARDSVVADAFRDTKSPYHAIVSVQDDKLFPEKHLPEPWNGHLESARILFVSSNPSIDSQEHFPTCSWKDDAICDYFDNRFEHQDPRKRIKFWTDALAKGTNWIGMCLDPKIKVDCNDGYTPLSRYIASTEIVHCKSRGEIGTRECAEDSFSRWMPKILRLFNGECVVLVGKFAQGYKANIKKILESFGKTSVKVIDMFHPGYHGLTDVTRCAYVQHQLGVEGGDVFIPEIEGKLKFPISETVARKMVESGLAQARHPKGFVLERSEYDKYTVEFYDLVMEKTEKSKYYRIVYWVDKEKSSKIDMYREKIGACWRPCGVPKVNIGTVQSERNVSGYVVKYALDRITDENIIEKFDMVKSVVGEIKRKLSSVGFLN